MPLSETQNVINEFIIPHPSKRYSSNYVSSIISKLYTFLPRGPIPFDTISHWMDLFYIYNVKYRIKILSFDKLIKTCICYTPEYDWGKLFEKEHFYNIIMQYQSLSKYFFVYDKPSESTNIRSLEQFYMVLLIYLSML